MRELLMRKTNSLRRVYAGRKMVSCALALHAMHHAMGRFGANVGRPLRHPRVARYKAVLAIR